jgi:hypothetical protein
MAGWHFVNVPKKQSNEIKKLYGTLTHAWGAVPVAVTICNTRWKTSIFPDKKSGSYLLPLKAEVRKKEQVFAGDTIIFTLDIML